MKIYVVKYALTKGIEECEAEPIAFSTNGEVNAKIKDKGQFGVVITKNDYSFIFYDARSKAYAMRDKKIASLKKQISNIEKMEF